MLSFLQVPSIAKLDICCEKVKIETNYTSYYNQVNISGIYWASNKSTLEGM